MQNLIEKLGLGESTGALMLWIGLAVLMLVVVLALATWLIRTLRPTLNLSGASGRGGRPQRLAITDAFTLDRDGRKLVIIRRDNVEHLILIGGPNDVVVEQNIVRGERAFRERTSARAIEPDAVQAAEAALTGDPSPQAAPPQAVAPQAVAPAIVRPVVAPVPPPAPPLRNAAPQPSVTQAPASARPEPAPRIDDEFERALSAMQQQVTQRQGAAPAQPAAPRPAPPVAPAAPQAPARQGQNPQIPVPQAPAQPAARAPESQPPVLPPAGMQPAPPRPPAPPAPPPASQRPDSPRPDSPRAEPMSEMARRLNEVLAKPMSGTLRPPFNRPIPPVPPVSSMTPRPMPPAAAPAPAEPAPAVQPMPAPAASTPAAPPPAATARPAAPPPGSEMDMLEEEMARLLGRPATPPKPGP